jgi:hypothetical protein
MGTAEQERLILFQKQLHLQCRSFYRGRVRVQTKSMITGSLPKVKRSLSKAVFLFYALCAMLYAASCKKEWAFLFCLKRNAP